MSDNDTRPSLESILFPCPEQNGGGRLRLRECDVVMGQSSGRIELLYNHNLNIQAKFEDSSTRQSPQKGKRILKVSIPSISSHQLVVHICCRHYTRIQRSKKPSRLPSEIKHPPGTLEFVFHKNENGKYEINVRFIELKASIEDPIYSWCDEEYNLYTMGIWSPRYGWNNAFLAYVWSHAELFGMQPEAVYRRQLHSQEGYEPDEADLAINSWLQIEKLHQQMIKLQHEHKITSDILVDTLFWLILKYGKEPFDKEIKDIKQMIKGHRLREPISPIWEYSIKKFIKYNKFDSESFLKKIPWFAPWTYIQKWHEISRPGLKWLQNRVEETISSHNDYPLHLKQMANIGNILSFLQNNTQVDASEKKITIPWPRAGDIGGTPRSLTDAGMGWLVCGRGKCATC